MDSMRWDGRKWPDHLHWQYKMQLLGEDDHGVWFNVPAGTVAKRGDVQAETLEVGFVYLVPRDRWWAAEFYADHSWLSCYVNIGTPCVWHTDRVTQVDLDLDVVRRVDGSIEIIDQDEFEEHQVLYGYPQELIDGAQQTADLMLLARQENREPFGEAAEQWLTAANLNTP